MKNFHKKTALAAEWARLQRREERFLKKIAMEKESVLNHRLEHLVPPKLSSTLDTAFYKAFEVVFEKGTPIIEKTYRKEDRETAYKVSAYAVSLKESRRNLKQQGGQTPGLRRQRNRAWRPWHWAARYSAVYGNAS